jgi:CelD/BcsL family acetyltransferase involved in cellulose biosynthesis
MVSGASGASAGVAGIELIGPNRLPELSAQWEELWRSLPAAGPFLAPGWVLPWVEAYATERTWGVALREGGRLSALLPVFAWERSLLLAGTGPSDHGGVPIRPGCEGRAGELLTAAARLPLSFGRIDLRQLPPDCPLAEASVSGWAAQASAGDACPVLRLEGEDGMAAVPPRTRANWRYAMRRIGREGGSIGLVSDGDVPEAIEALIELHGSRWRERGEAGVLAGESMRRFLRRAASALADAGLLRLFRLRFGRRDAALLFAMGGGETLCYYIGGFDPEFASLSPGTTLIGAAIAAAAQEGLREFDFLRGGEAYKHGWGAVDRPRLRRVLTPVS